MQALDAVRVPEAFDYAGARALSNEAREKLALIRPGNLGQASRISGITPADVQALLVLVRRSSTSDKNLSLICRIHKTH